MEIEHFWALGTGGKCQNHTHMQSELKDAFLYTFLKQGKMQYF